MDIKGERLHFEMPFDGEVEDVYITVTPKTHQRFEAWVEVRGVVMYGWVYKDEQKDKLPSLLMPYIERCYEESIKLITPDYWDS